MARGTTLSQMIAMLREELAQASSPALGQNNRPTLARKLKRTYEVLYGRFDWEHLKIYRDKDLSAGARYYAFPTDLEFERVNKVEVLHSGQWIPVCYGISAEQYNIFNPDRGERSDPVERWQAYEDDQFEVWPLPAAGAGSADGKLRFWGVKKFAPLVAESDRALLDDNMVVLYAAAEILAKAKAQDAQAKLAQANTLYDQLTGRGKKSRVFSMAGPSDEPPRREVRVTYARAG